VIYSHGEFYGDSFYDEWKNLGSTNAAVLLKDIPGHKTYIDNWWQLVNAAAK
jgi:hypothetical protein